MQIITPRVAVADRPGVSQDPSERAPLRYEDALRVIGHLLDTRGWCNICLREYESGIQILAEPAEESGAPPVAIVLSEAEIRQLVRAAVGRRGTGRASVLLAAADAATRTT